MERKRVFGEFIMLKVEENIVVAAGCYGLGVWFFGWGEGTEQQNLISCCLWKIFHICLMILR